MDASSTWECPQITAALVALSFGGKRHVSSYSHVSFNCAQSGRWPAVVQYNPHTLIKTARGLQWLCVTLLINKHYVPPVPMKRD